MKRLKWAAKTIAYAAAGLIGVIIILAVVVELATPTVDVPALEPAKVTKIHVASGLAVSQDIHDRTQIDKIVAFVNARPTGWQRPAFESPMSQVTVWFFVGERQERGFGVGCNFFWTQPDSTRDASDEERRIFLALIGLDGPTAPKFVGCDSSSFLVWLRRAI
jgi:hypothetical protein